MSKLNNEERSKERFGDLTDFTPEEVNELIFDVDATIQDIKRQLELRTGNNEEWFWRAVAKKRYLKADLKYLAKVHQEKLFQRAQKRRSDELKEKNRRQHKQIMELTAKLSALKEIVGLDVYIDVCQEVQGRMRGCDEQKT